MKLTYSQIKDFALGAESVVETELGISFYRFTEEELELYSTTQFADKSYATAGIRLAFETDASALTLGVNIAFGGSSRSYFAIEVFQDGKRAGILKNYPDGATFNEMRTGCSDGDFEKTFPLSPGKKTIEIYLPWSVTPTITELTLNNATFANKIHRERILLMYGDSITHGYDAALPSQSYSNRFADALGMQVYNKAIGGEVFFPALAECEPTLAPEVITVAYGTNDWNKTDPATFEQNSRAFLQALAERHPQAKIFVFTPIWRKDHGLEKPFSSFSAIAEHLTAVAQELPNGIVLKGIDFVPHDAKFYADRRLHPNDEGFDHYFNNLYAVIKNHLE
ncbi:MAG: SGNH/GDSL hydrolase family protein [Clostridia bacterium]|nr:SGNH/GDSL hydrolase family protein [Clostridia bacterium]